MFKKYLTNIKNHEIVVTLKKSQRCQRAGTQSKDAMQGCKAAGRPARGLLGTTDETPVPAHPGSAAANRPGR